MFLNKHWQKILTFSGWMIYVLYDMVKKFIFSCNLFQKVKLSYILDLLHVK